MADGVCEAGTGVCVNDPLLVNENEVFISENSEESVNTDKLNNLKSSFYLIDENSGLCSNFRLNGVVNEACSELDVCLVMGSDHEEFSSEFKSMCSDNEDNCRKKRCTDRYDSSESSDSGVAVLSCTDCSGSSSGTSDITEPGSPFSTTSSHSSTSESDPENSVPCSGKMPPTQSTESTTWPWSTDSNGGPKQQFLEPATVKRFKSSLENNNDNRRTGSNGDDNDCVIRKQCFRPVQGKITEYFKTQIKSQQKKCDIRVKLQKNGTLVPINSNKLSVYLSGKCVPTVLAVPVKEKLPDVFQREEKTQEPLSEIKESIDLVTVAAKRNGISCLTPSPIHRKTIEHENAVTTEVTHIFRKPSSVPKTSRPSASPLPAAEICSANGVPSVSLLKPKTQNSSSPLSSVEDYPVTSSPSSSLVDDDDVNKITVATNSVITTTTTTTCLTMNVVNSEQSNSNSNSNNNNSENCSEQSFVADKPSLPSPILSAPRTIRFPARNGWKGHYLSDIVCRWSECESSFNTSTALLEHLQVSHVNTQSLCESFVCLWVGCKVYERTSCSRSWLERHVLSHGGNKPYRCIVDGCGQRFSSQIILERHVNSHFNSTESSSNGGSGTRRNVEAVTNKLFRRNGKKLRYRRQPYSARMFDYFDAGIMERLQYSLVQMTERRTNGLVDGTAGNTIALQSKIIGQRVEPDGTKSMLLRWFPPNIVGDEWVGEKEVKPIKHVPLPSLSQSQESRDACTQALFRPGRHRKPRKQSVIAR